MKKDKIIGYIHIILGAIGIILVGLATLRYQFSIEDLEGQIISYIGFVLTIN
ncbi:hypothetical protein [Paenibacillus sp. CMAA1364]